MLPELLHVIFVFLPISDSLAPSQSLLLPFPFSLFLPPCHPLCSHFFPSLLFSSPSPPISPTPPSHGVAVPVALVFTSPVVWCVGTSVSTAMVSMPESECVCVSLRLRLCAEVMGVCVYDGVNMSLTV